MPTKAKELLDYLCVDSTDPSSRMFSAAKLNSDPNYGEGVRKTVLFPPLISEE